MTEHRGLDHKGVLRDCIQEWHWCGGRDGVLRYRTVLADPPWDFGKTRFISGPDGAGKPFNHAPLPYPSLSVAEIAALPVAQWVEDDALLFLWTTSRHLPEAFSVVSAWGFTYSQTIVWAKPNPFPLPMPFAPPATEFLLACKRGKPALRSTFPSSVISARSTRQHSQKPDAFIDYAEQAGHPPYLEMFARRKRLGWDVYGNEVSTSALVYETLTPAQRAGLTPETV